MLSIVRIPDDLTQFAGEVLMAVSIYNIAKAPLGWSIYCDGVKIGGVFGSKAAAFEAATVAASFAIQDGSGVQINVPDVPSSDEIPAKWIAPTK